VASLSHRRCACGTVYDVLTHNGKSIGMDRADNGTACPSCDKDEFVRLVGVPVGIEMGDEAGYGKTYPYFDRGLGRRVSSSAHRKKLCEELGVEACDDGGGDVVTDGVSSARKAQWRAEDKAEKDFHDYVERLEKDPAFSEYRRMRARGAYDHWNAR